MAGIGYVEIAIGQDPQRQIDLARIGLSVWSKASSLMERLPPDRQHRHRDPRPAGPRCRLAR